jgi:uncharacterized protein YndB with AHSA1/START domain
VSEGLVKPDGRGHDEAVTQAGIATGAASSVISSSVISSSVISSSAVRLQFTPASFDVRTELVLHAGRRRVFDALLHIAAWWPHRVRAGTPVVFEPRVGGRFFENCDDGCGVLLGQVSRLVTPEEFAIEGSFGLDGPVVASWRVTLDADDHEHTSLHGRLQAFGAIDEQTREAASARADAVYSALAHYLDA